MSMKETDEKVELDRGNVIEEGAWLVNEEEYNAYRVNKLFVLEDGTTHIQLSEFMIAPPSEIGTKRYAIMSETGNMSLTVDDIYSRLIDTTDSLTFMDDNKKPI